MQKSVKTRAVTRVVPVLLVKAPSGRAEGFPVPGPGGGTDDPCHGLASGPSDSHEDCTPTHVHRPFIH